MMQVASFHDDPRRLQAFLDLGERLQRRHGQILPFRQAVAAQLQAKGETNRDDWRLFVATDGKTPVARCAAMIDPQDDAGLGMIGYFEAEPPYAAAEAVLREAVEWLAARGVRTIRGPLNGSTYFPYRFMTEGFDAPTFLMEPQNPPHYPEYWERFGFRSCRSYRSARVDSAAFAAAVAPHHARAMAAGYHARRFDLARFDAELALMHALSTAIFQGSWMWRPIDLPHFRALYAGMRDLLDADLCHFLYRESTPVGFIFGLPDYGPAVRAMNGRQSLAAKLRFLAKRHERPAALLKTFGVLPEHRNGSLALALTHLMHAEAARKGYATTIHALMREDNTSLRMSERFGAEAFKRYDLFELEVAGHA